MRIIRYDRIDSTSAQAARLIVSGDPGDVWIQADSQISGRGRRGKAWTSSPGNLFCTYVFYPDMTAMQAALYGFVAANAVAQTVQTYLPGAKVGIKWPNDVRIDGAKISGILLETGTHDGRLWLSVGIGINLLSAPVGTPYPVTNIAAHLNSDDPEHIPNAAAALAVLAKHFETGSQDFQRFGFARARELWLSRADGLGKTVSASARDGKVIGTMTGLSETGELQVRLPDGRDTLIASGEVFLGTQYASGN